MKALTFGRLDHAGHAGAAIVAEDHADGAVVVEFDLVVGPAWFGDVDPSRVVVLDAEK